MFPLKKFNDLSNGTEVLIFDNIVAVCWINGIFQVNLKYSSFIESDSEILTLQELKSARLGKFEQ